jgi:hypothetical protein
VTEEKHLEEKQSFNCYRHHHSKTTQHEVGWEIISATLPPKPNNQPFKEREREGTKSQVE